MTANQCVSCGADVPEGDQVCRGCSRSVELDLRKSLRELEFVCAKDKKRGGVEYMTMGEYQGLAMRTMPENYESKLMQLINAALGLTGESGEVADLVKKAAFQGHEVNKQKLIDELGDVLWYVALGAEALGISMGEIAENNIAKLRKRYPKGFDPENSIRREKRGIWEVGKIGGF